MSFLLNIVERYYFTIGIPSKPQGYKNTSKSIDQYQLHYWF